MKSVLFPTDFTETSLNAFKYAMEYAQKSEAKLIIFHAYTQNSSISEETQKVYDKVDIQNFRNKKDKFPLFEKMIAESKVGQLKIRYVVYEGEFVDCLNTYVAKKEDKIELIIMGTQMKSKVLFNIFMESDTNKILEEINKPVIAVPATAQFDGSFDNIAFLVDYKQDEIAPLQVIIEKSVTFQSNLHVLHFDLAHGETISPLMDKFKSSLDSSNLENVSFVSIDTINLKKSLVDYCLTHGIDMICLINHKRNFYQRLFSLSLTQDLLQNIDIPVMAIYAE